MLNKILNTLVCFVIAVSAPLFGKQTLQDCYSNSLRWPALHYAISLHREDLAGYILKKNPDQALLFTPDVHATDCSPVEKGKSSIILAAECQCLQTLKDLLSLGIDPSSSWSYSVMAPGGTETITVTPLHYALQNNNAEMVDVLLDAKARVGNIYVSEKEADKKAYCAFKDSIVLNQDDMLKHLLLKLKTPQADASKVERAASLIKMYCQKDIKSSLIAHAIDDDQNKDAMLLLLQFGIKPIGNDLFVKAWNKHDPSLLENLFAFGYPISNAFETSLSQNLEGAPQWLLNYSAQKHITIEGAAEKAAKYNRKDLLDQINSLR